MARNDEADKQSQPIPGASRALPSGAMGWQNHMLRETCDGVVGERGERSDEEEKGRGEDV